MTKCDAPILLKLLLDLLQVRIQLCLYVVASVVSCVKSRIDASLGLWYFNAAISSLDTLPDDLLLEFFERLSDRRRHQTTLFFILQQQLESIGFQLIFHFGQFF